VHDHANDVDLGSSVVKRTSQKRKRCEIKIIIYHKDFSGDKRGLFSDVFIKLFYVIQFCFNCAKKVGKVFRSFPSLVSNKPHSIY